MQNLDNLIGLIIGGVALAIFVAVAWYVLSKLRNAKKTVQPTAEELLATFGSLRDENVMSKEEFNAVKRALASTLVAKPEFKENDAAKDRDATLESLLRSERRGL